MKPSKKTIYTYLAEKRPDQPLFLDERGNTVTCGRAREHVEALAVQLRQTRIQAGGIVVLRMPRTAEAAMMELALLAAGFQAMLSDPHMTVLDYFQRKEFENTAGYLTDEGGSWTLVSPTGRDTDMTGIPGSLKKPASDAMAPAVLITTSGSTGDRKTVVLSQYNIVNNLVDANAFGDYVPGDVALGILPLFHIFGQVLLFGSLILDYSIVFPETVTPDSALQCVERFRVTRMNGVPSLYLAMAEKADGYDTETLRVGFIGGSPCTLEEIQRIENRLGMKLLNAYGMSECVSISISSANDSPMQRIGGVGRVYPMSRVRIVDRNGAEVPEGTEGEITVNGASRMLGYYRDEEATGSVIDGAGFLHTGDLGYLDQDGILHITGRIKDIIIRNGVNISARAVEEAMQGIEGIWQAIVVGIPDKKQGEVPAAVYTGELAETALRRELERKLPKNMLPTMLFAVTAIPMTESGKPDKQKIRKQLLAFSG